MAELFDVRDLKTPSDYRKEGREHIFPTEGSLLYFIQSNRKLLIEFKAIIKPTGRIMINSKEFDKLVFEIGASNWPWWAHVR